jgi:glucose/mannose-6-phosphate isomerase
MERMIGTWGEQLRWSSRLDARAAPAPEQILICGMGGSGITGDFAVPLCSVPAYVHKGYGLPSWAGQARPMVLAVSYSGNTEETLSAVTEARAGGLPIAVVSGGGRLQELAGSEDWPTVGVPTGLQPRAALGYLLGGALSLLGAWGVTSVGDAELAAAADLADSLLVEGGAARILAAELAGGLVGRMVGVYGSQGLVAPAAQRWKTQINENAKWPAWWSLFPEIDHNEIVSWTSLSQVTKNQVGLIVLRDRDEGARVAARIRLTAEVTEPNVNWVGEVWSQGEHPLERMVSLAVMGDLVSVELARLVGVDPVPVEALENLKQKLAEEPS